MSPFEMMTLLFGLAGEFFGSGDRDNLTDRCGAFDLYLDKFELSVTSDFLYTPLLGVG